MALRVPNTRSTFTGPDMLSHEKPQVLEALIVRAAESGHFDQVRFLIAQGIPAKAALPSGVTPLHTSACEGHHDIVKLLLSNGADPCAKTRHGITPLHLAAMKNHDSIAAMLVDSGADMRAKAANGQTALQYAVHFNSTLVVRTLLQHENGSSVEDDSDSSCSYDSRPSSPRQALLSDQPMLDAAEKRQAGHRNSQPVAIDSMLRTLSSSNLDAHSPIKAGSTLAQAVLPHEHGGSYTTLAKPAGMSKSMNPESEQGVLADCLLFTESDDVLDERKRTATSKRKRCVPDACAPAVVKLRRTSTAESHVCDGLATSQSPFDQLLNLTAAVTLEQLVNVTDLQDKLTSIAAESLMWKCKVEANCWHLQRRLHRLERLLLVHLKSHAQLADSETSTSGCVQIDD